MFPNWKNTITILFSVPSEGENIKIMDKRYLAQVKQGPQQPKEKRTYHSVFKLPTEIDILTFYFHIYSVLYPWNIHINHDLFIPFFISFSNKKKRLDYSSPMWLADCITVFSYTSDSLYLRQISNLSNEFQT